MSEHTKGPWLIEDSFVYTLDKKGRQCCVALCAWHNRPRAEAEANARLVAMAPEMCEALEIAVIKLEDLCDVCDRKTGCQVPFCEFGEAKDKLKSVLQKARGEE